MLKGRATSRGNLACQLLRQGSVSGPSYNHCAYTTGRFSRAFKFLLTKCFRNDRGICNRGPIPWQGRQLGSNY